MKTGKVGRNVGEREKNYMYIVLLFICGTQWCL